MRNLFSGLWIYRAVFSALSPPPPKFLPKNVPDLTGRVIIVTGERSCIS